MAFFVELRSQSTRERWVSCYHNAARDADMGSHHVQVPYDADLGTLGWKRRPLLRGAEVCYRNICPKHATHFDESW